MTLSKSMQNNIYTSTEVSQNVSASSDSAKTAHEAYFAPFNNDPMIGIYGEEESKPMLEQLEESMSFRSEQYEQKEKKNLEALLSMEYVFTPLQEENSFVDVQQDLADIRKSMALNPQT